jgi:type II secretory pathway component GspD/PulD (secretin)
MLIGVRDGRFSRTKDPAMRIVIVSIALAVAFFTPLRDLKADPPAGQVVQLELLIADTTGPIAGDVTAAAILEMETKGQLASGARIRLTTLEQQEAQVHFGERVPVPIGRVFRGGDRAAETTYNTENTGTLLQATTRVEQDGSIIAQVTVDQTRLAPSKPTPRDEPAPGIELRRTEQISTRTTVRLTSGKPVIIGSRDASTGGEGAQTYLVLTATLPEPKAAAAAPAVQLKVVPLTNARASEVARIVTEALPREPFKVGVDERTNSLLVTGEAAALETVLALVALLDEAK